MFLFFIEYVFDEVGPYSSRLFWLYPLLN